MTRADLPPQHRYWPPLGGPWPPLGGPRKPLGGPAPPGRWYTPLGAPPRRPRDDDSDDDSPGLA